MKPKINPEEINDDFSYVSERDGKTYKMSTKEKLFCESYLEFSGNGVDAIFEAGYDVKNRPTAAAMAHEMLRKPNLMSYINSLLVQYGFSDDNVEKQHLYLLNQHGDLKSKGKAIDMYYKIRGSYAAEKKEIAITDLSALLDEIE